MVSSMPVSRRTVSLVAAVVLAAFATLSLVAYVRGVERQALGRGDSLEVFVARDRIPEGTSTDAAIAKKLFGRTAMPAKAVVEGVVTDLAAIRGKVAGAEINRGEQILGSRFVTQTRARGALPIPDDRQAMSIEVPPPAGVSGYVRAGDRVSVIARAGKSGSGDARVGYLLQNVEVLAVGQRTPSNGDNAPVASSPVAGKVALTLAVTASEAEKLGYALLQGEIYVTLLPPGQARVSPAAGRTADSLFS